MSKRNFIKGAGMYLCIGLLGGHFSLLANYYSTEKKDQVMTAKELYDVFKNDQEAALKKYGGKTVTLTGIVVYTGPDVYTLPSVELSERKGGKARTLCVLPFSDYLKLRKVSKGKEATITGEVRGFYEKGDQVLLKQCKIKE